MVGGLGEVHDDGDDRDTDGRRVWTPVAFQQPGPPQHARLHSKGEEDKATSMDKVFGLRAPPFAGLGRATGPNGSRVRNSWSFSREKRRGIAGRGRSEEEGEMQTASPSYLREKQASRRWQRRRCGLSKTRRKRRREEEKDFWRITPWVFL